ncbi:MAG: PIN domain-containing protein [Nocardioidaceae bacterium]|nr:PIN domain-containing protein [Nocardioidaceae bacterium]
MACDSSILIPALNPRHPDHAAVREVRPQLTTMLAHVLLESYSVLTRMPVPYQLPAVEVARAIGGLGLDVAGLPEARQIEMVAACAAAGIDGGSVYDAVVAATAQHHGLTLITRDRRARTTYDAIGVSYTLI